ncbi:hypothetical protein ACFE04_023908 [Oxalis oulophora]
MKKKNTRGCPSFFKVLVGDFSTKLMVPPAFMKNFNGELPKITTLKSSTEIKSWGVLMEKTEKYYYFNKGWSKFVTDHCLQYGDFLVFKLITNSSFEVVIYDGDDECEKDTSFIHKQHATTPSTLLPNSMIKKVNHKKKKKETTLVASPTLLPNAMIKKVDRERKMIVPKTEAANVYHIEPENIVIQKANHEKKMTVPKTEPAGVGHIEHVNNLYFVKEMTCQTMKYNICVPVTFGKETGLESMNTVTLKYTTEAGVEEEWPVEVQKQNEIHDRVRLGLGWLKFWTAKGLSVGDSCLFEFIDGSLHVNVFRKVIKKANNEKKDIETKTAAFNVDSINPPNNLHFVKLITSQLMKYRFCVPVNFGRETGLVSKNTVMLKYINEDGSCEEWPVEVRKQNERHDRVSLRSGWFKFWTAKGISVGDSCLLEFIDGNFLVKVIRKGENSNCT